MNAWTLPFRNRRSRITRASFALVPLALFAACGGGGGGAGASDAPAQKVAGLTSAAGQVPVVGDLIADCRDSGVAVADSLIDGVNSLGALPASLPTLSQVIDIGDLDQLPIVGGLVAGNGASELLPIPLDSVLGLLPGGVGDLAGGLVAGQLPVLCSTVVGNLPLDALQDPAALVASLGLPIGALGVIPIFDQQHNPVGSLLTVVLDELPGLTSLVLGPLSGIPIVGGALSSLVSSLLGLLSGNGLLGGLLGGGLLNLVLGLVP